MPLVKLPICKINKLVMLQKCIRLNIKKRIKIIHKAIDTYTDLIHVLNA